jgi:hypothetical protein
MPKTAMDTPKAPRWITTEAGAWAWRERETWRSTATHAMSVQQRRKLLQEAEQLRQVQQRSA